ncbi:MAG: cellulase family glycosylhydrolase [Anaerolineae bacterium]|nr:cellulase family glycosylhydrolase [Candidatus Roseilinea sp.]MDW8450694.1 cellulase family glycosylhydrolase [Anaerolineae bacterium]
MIPRRLIPLLAFVALAWLLLHVRPPQLLVTLGPQQSVVTRNVLAGMHTRFVEEAEAWKIKRGLEMVREMGAPWIVEFFPWAYYEKAKGQRDFSGADRIVDHANRQGLTVIARLGFVPEWARPPDSTFTHLDPPHYDDFANFAAAFASHFKGRVSHFIIWNEPNLQNEWGMRRVDPAAYVEMLRAVYPAIKQANPDAIVLAGALAPTTERNRDVALSDLAYLEEMYATLADLQTPTSNLPWDALAVHSYGTTMPPEEPPAPEKINFRRVELLRATMLVHGDDAPIYITEAGWNDDVNWVNGVTPAQRIDYTIRALDYARVHWPWVRCVAFWVFKLPAPARGYRDHFTFVTPSLEPLPIYEEVQRALVP